MVASAQPSFRQATTADHAIVVQLLRELVDELGPSDGSNRIKSLLDGDIKLALASSQVRIFLVEVDGQVVGLGRADVLTTDPIFRLRDDHRCGYIDQMFVRPAFRDRGLGSQLMRLCEDWFRQQGIAHSVLHAAPKALRFYAREGYM